MFGKKQKPIDLKTCLIYSEATLLMGKIGKIILGVLSIWPILYFGFFTQVMVPRILQDGFEGPYMATFLIVHLLTLLLCAVLFFVYLLKVIRNPKLGSQRTGWILGVIFLNGVAWPVYWYLHIWKNE